MGAVVPLDRSEGMLNQFLAFLHVFRVAADRNLNPRVRLFSPSEVVVRRVLFYVRDLLEGDLGIAVAVISGADNGSFLCCLGCLFWGPFVILSFY